MQSVKSPGRFFVIAGESKQSSGNIGLRGCFWTPAAAKAASR
jgi:hypothetical protein